MIQNDVHPEFPRILEPLSPTDTAILAEIGGSTDKEAVKKAVKATAYKFHIMGVSFSSYFEEETDFSREHLRNLNLIIKSSGQFRLTLIGEEFLKSVADPVFGAGNAEQGASPDGYSADAS
ncbi:MAG: hypothetical protein D3904_06250 [Candidatus Electrothrix sp. EH2]|nr:hypothetical protein [Candidatus Electrothrix sp. EH2]